MNTETATITATSRDTLVATQEGFIDVEVTYQLGDEIEVCKYAYPLNTTKAEIREDLKKYLKTRKQDRENRQLQLAEEEATAEKAAEEAAADKTVASLMGTTVK